MRYTLKWFDESSWTVREEALEAASRSAAMQQALDRGLQPLSIRPALRFGILQRRASLDVEAWCKELRLLLAAGMTVVEAIETLRAQAGSGPRARLLDRIHAALCEGKSLSAALIDTAAFPPMLIAGVVSSERTGSLLDALDDYLRYHGLIEQLRRKLVSAAIYPLLVLGVGTFVVLFLLWFVVPRFSASYAELRGAIGGTTQFLVHASDFLRGHSTALGIALALAVLACAGAAHLGLLHGVVSRLAEAAPPMRATMDEFKRAKLFHALALMFRGGYALPEGLERCANMGLGQRWSKAALQARDAVTTGQGVAVALGAAGLTDPTTEQLLRVGERSGSFAHVLQAIADRHSQRFATAIERLTRLVEPTLLLLVAAAVGGVVVLMYLPIFDLAGALR